MPWRPQVLVVGLARCLIRKTSVCLRQAVQDVRHLVGITELIGSHLSHALMYALFDQLQITLATLQS
jgi:hypothetical protein